MEQQNRDNKRSEPAYSTRVKAGRRRTYFIDVRPTRTDEFYLTITESKKLNDDTYEKHKIFIYKEDFNKFLLALQDTITHIKTELMPGVDFEQFDHKEFSNNNENYSNNSGAGDSSYNKTENYSNEPAEKKQEDNIPEAPENIQPPTSSNTSDDDLKW